MLDLTSLSYGNIPSFCRWLSDIFTPRPVIIAGLIISVIPFATIAPSPILRPLFSALNIPETVLIWASSALVGIGCAFGFSPVVPAILGYTDFVRLFMIFFITAFFAVLLNTLISVSWCKNKVDIMVMVMIVMHYNHQHPQSTPRIASDKVQHNKCVDLDFYWGGLLIQSYFILASNILRPAFKLLLIRAQAQ